jgi:hypothetical protein
MDGELTHFGTARNRNRVLPDAQFSVRHPHAPSPCADPAVASRVPPARNGMIRRAGRALTAQDSAARKAETLKKAD